MYSSFTTCYNFLSNLNQESYELCLHHNQEEIYLKIPKKISYRDLHHYENNSKTQQIFLLFIENLVRHIDYNQESKIFCWRLAKGVFKQVQQTHSPFFWQITQYLTLNFFRISYSKECVNFFKQLSVFGKHSYAKELIHHVLLKWIQHFPYLKKYFVALAIKMGIEDLAMEFLHLFNKEKERTLLYDLGVEGGCKHLIQHLYTECMIFPEKDRLHWNNMCLLALKWGQDCLSTPIKSLNQTLQLDKNYFNDLQFLGEIETTIRVLEIVSQHPLINMDKIKHLLFLAALERKDPKLITYILQSFKEWNLSGYEKEVINFKEPDLVQAYFLRREVEDRFFYAVWLIQMERENDAKILILNSYLNKEELITFLSYLIEKKQFGLIEFCLDNFSKEIFKNLEAFINHALTHKVYEFFYQLLKKNSEKQSEIIQLVLNFLINQGEPLETEDEMNTEEVEKFLQFLIEKLPPCLSIEDAANFFVKLSEMGFFDQAEIILKNYSGFILDDLSFMRKKCENNFYQKTMEILTSQGRIDWKSAFKSLSERGENEKASFLLRNHVKSKSKNCPILEIICQTGNENLFKYYYETYGFTNPEKVFENCLENIHYPLIKHLYDHCNFSFQIKEIYTIIQAKKNGQRQGKIELLRWMMERFVQQESQLKEIVRKLLEVKEYDLLIDLLPFFKNELRKIVKFFLEKELYPKVEQILIKKENRSFTLYFEVLCLAIQNKIDNPHRSTIVNYSSIIYDLCKNNHLRTLEKKTLQNFIKCAMIENHCEALNFLIRFPEFNHAEFSITPLTVNIDPNVGIFLYKNSLITDLDWQKICSEFEKWMIEKTFIMRDYEIRS